MGFYLYCCQYVYPSHLKNMFPTPLTVLRNRPKLCTDFTSYIDDRHVTFFILERGGVQQGFVDEVEM